MRVLIHSQPGQPADIAFWVGEDGELEESVRRRSPGLAAAREYVGQWYSRVPWMETCVYLARKSPYVHAFVYIDVIGNPEFALAAREAALAAAS